MFGEALIEEQDRIVGALGTNPLNQIVQNGREEGAYNGCYQNRDPKNEAC